MNINKSHVDEILKVSGQQGIIIDINHKPREKVQEIDFARIKMQSKIADILKKVESFPPRLRTETRGVIPSYWGYNVRVTKQHEADIMKLRNPQEAAELGLALGMIASSEWVVKGIPSYASKAQIRTTLAQSASGWPGWTVRPRKT